MSPKDPLEELDYSLDWSLVIGTDTITSSTWTVTNGSSIVQSSSISGKTTIAWIAGGLASIETRVRNTIKTSSGRTLVQTIKIPMAAL